MKKIAVIIAGLVVSLTTFGQGKYGATPDDSIACIESLIYKDYMKSDQKLALELWKVAYKVCPQSQKTLYINGVKLYGTLAKAAGKAKNTELKEAYVDTMMSIYDQRIEMFGQKGFVLGYKGQSMLVNRPKEKEQIFALLDEAVSITGNKTQSGTLVALMFATINLEKIGKKSKDDVVAMFEKLTAITAANATGKYAEKYTKAEDKINNVVGPYMTCEILIPLSEKNYEANKENVDWLRKTTKLLKVKKCYESEIFSKVAEAYFKLEPSASAAEGMGNLFLGKKDYSRAIEFFKKALEMAETDEEKAAYCMSIAKTYLYSKSYSSVRTYAKKALGFKSGMGDAYMLIGDAYMYSASSCDDKKLGRYGAYWAAVDKYQKAKSVDATVANDANKKIAKASANYPETQDLFFYNKKAGDSYVVACWINETTSVRSK